MSPQQLIGAALAATPLGRNRRRDAARRAAVAAYRDTHDALTGLADGPRFRERVASGLTVAGSRISVLVLGLDGVDRVATGLGAALADELLVRIAYRLDSGARAGDTVARIGRHEFAVLLEDDGDPEAVAARFVQAVAQPVSLAVPAVSVRCWMGIATVDAVNPDPGQGADAGARSCSPETTAAGMIDLARTRMVSARLEGRDRVSAGASTELALTRH